LGVSDDANSVPKSKSNSVSSNTDSESDRFTPTIQEAEKYLTVTTEEAPMNVSEEMII
jgi:hypothetical protein